MKTIINYQSDTGEIQFIYSPSIDLEAETYQPPEGISALIVDGELPQFNLMTNVVVDGSLMERPIRPSKFHNWSGETWKWLFDTEAMRLDSRGRIDFIAGQARARYITIAPGQGATYSAKYQQAIAFLEATNPILDDYPWIKMESQATGMTPVDCAIRIQMLGDQWANVLGPTIEAIRIAGKDALDAMVDPTYEQVQTHVDSVLTQLEAV